MNDRNPGVSTNIESTQTAIRRVLNQNNLVSKRKQNKKSNLYLYISFLIY